jgi:methyltransferase OMS1
MLQEAKSKFEQYSDKFKRAFINFKRADVQDIATLTTDDGKPAKFDTVIDTFGLCSCSDPVEAIISMANACNDSENSRILLLEHGRSHYEWLNNLLDKNADKHVSKWGCWWNRDFMKIFEDERVTREIDVEKVSRWHLGTTYYVIAKKKSKKLDQLLDQPCI